MPPQGKEVLRRGVLRRAAPADLARVFEIWTSVDEHRFRDGWERFAATAGAQLAAGRLWVWADSRAVHGFAAADPASGEIEAVYVHPGAQGRGIGRALLRKCCDYLLRRGHRHAWLLTSPGSRAERIYRDDSWREVAVEPSGAIRLRKWLVA